MEDGDKEVDDIESAEEMGVGKVAVGRDIDDMMGTVRPAGVDVDIVGPSLVIEVSSTIDLPTLTVLETTPGVSKLILDTVKLDHGSIQKRG